MFGTLTSKNFGFEKNSDDKALRLKMPEAPPPFGVHNDRPQTNCMPREAPTLKERPNYPERESLLTPGSGVVHSSEGRAKASMFV